MSITSRCNGCGATSLNGSLSHIGGCPAKKPEIHLGNIMPSTTITFDSPEEAKKFADSLKGSQSGGTLMIPTVQLSNPTNKDSLDSVVFDFTNPEDLEARVRMLIAAARSEVKEPKDRYVSRIFRAFKEAGYAKSDTDVSVGNKDFDAFLDEVLYAVYHDCSSHNATRSGCKELQLTPDEAKSRITAEVERQVLEARKKEHQSWSIVYGIGYDPDNVELSENILTLRRKWSKDELDINAKLEQKGTL